jgi:GTP-binding protein EngB required for normal cell division
MSGVMRHAIAPIDTQPCDDIDVAKGPISQRPAVYSPNHQRYLFSRLHYIDETLGDAVQALQPTDEGRLFKPLIPDATAAQRKVLGDYLTQLRFALRAFIETQQLQEIPRSVSGLWSVRTAVIFAQNAVTELRPSYMRGYGPLDEEAAATSERLVAELTTLLKRIGDYLDKGEQGDLASRLAQLDGTREEIPLLRELERVITEHGLVELRAPLESLIARAAAPRYEIAVFGRVNSGKSSLLNWWLGQSMLPTGVTPVTAVPTRIAHGPVARARVRLASSPIRDIPLNQLPEFVTETGNPGNRKRVLEIQVEVPSERLRQEITLVDTPGLGSIAAAGAAQTLEYLPHCDLGIQLVEAGGMLAPEDLAVARAILDGGSDLLVALSKADRLSGPELAESRAYVTRTVGEALGLRVSVGPISTVSAHAAIASDWFETEVAPRLATHREQAAALLKRKVGALRITVIAVLAARLGSGPSEPMRDSTDDFSADSQEVARARADLERGRSDLLEHSARVADCAPWLAAAVAQELVGYWLKHTGHGSDPADLRAATARRAAEIGDVIVDELKAHAPRLRNVLAKVSADSKAAEELPYPRGRPLFDADSIAPPANCPRPWWTLGVPRLQRWAARDLIEGSMGKLLREQLAVYATALRLWGSRYLDELAQHFEQALAGSEGVQRFRAASPPDSGAAVAMRRDLNLLERWPARAS